MATTNEGWCLASGPVPPMTKLMDQRRRLAFKILPDLCLLEPPSWRLHCPKSVNSTALFLECMCVTGFYES